jgi:F-type H+-transporting ATPase subunit b
MRKRHVALVLLVVLLAVAGPAALWAQPEHGAAAEHGNPVRDMLAKLLNFALLAGTLVYFLRLPLATYLSDRGTQIRSDLVKAADMKKSAASRLAQVDTKMAALPGELDALRRTGAEEVAAEEARIRQAAEAERARLIEQSTREIDWQLKIAERDLTRHAGALAVDLATRKIRATITDADQLRLVDRYVAQVGK